MQDMKVWDRRFGRQDITTPSIKTLNSPLCSTFIHSYPIKKISVRIISHTKPPNHPFKSLPNPICDGIQSILLVGYGAMGLSGIMNLWSKSYALNVDKPSIVTMGIMGYCVKIVLLAIPADFW